MSSFDPRPVHVFDVGVCGTCAMPAQSTSENEGYSDCCNDRIEYDLEASETLQRNLAERQEYVAESTRKIASLSSRRSKARRDGDAEREEALTKEIDAARSWKRSAQDDVRRLKKTIKDWRNR